MRTPSLTNWLGDKVRKNRVLLYFSVTRACLFISHSVESSFSSNIDMGKFYSGGSKKSVNEGAVNTLEGMTPGKAKVYSKCFVEDSPFNELGDTTVCSGFVIFVHLSVFGIKSGSGIGVI